MRFSFACLLIVLLFFSCSMPQDTPADGTTLTLYVDDSSPSTSMIRPDTDSYQNQGVSHYRFLMYSFATEPAESDVKAIADGSFSNPAFTSQLLPKKDGKFEFSGMPSGDWWVVKADAYVVTDSTQSTASFATIPADAFLVSTGTTSEAVHLVSSAVETKVSIDTPVSSENAGDITITVSLPSGTTAVSANSCTITAVTATEASVTAALTVDSTGISDTNKITSIIAGDNLKSLPFGSYRIEIPFTLTVSGKEITRTGQEVLYWIPGLPATGSIDLAYSESADTGGLDITDNSGSEITIPISYRFNNGNLELSTAYAANKKYSLYVYIDNAKKEAGSSAVSGSNYVWTISDIAEDSKSLKVIIKDGTPYGIGSYEAELNSSATGWTQMTVSGAEGEETT